nr:D578 [uncultured bacterium]
MEPAAALPVPRRPVWRARVLVLATKPVPALVWVMLSVPQPVSGVLTPCQWPAR